MVCASQINLSIPAPASQCRVRITPDLLGARAPGCNGMLDVDLYTSSGQLIQGEIDSTGARIGIVNEIFLGQTIIARTSVRGLGQSCDTRLHILDGLAPLLLIQDDSLSIAAPIHPDSGFVKIPVVEDCSAVTLSYQDSVDAQGCNGEAFAKTIRTWTAFDAFGNRSTARQVIVQFAVQLSEIIVPPDTIISCSVGSVAGLGYGTLELYAYGDTIPVHSLDGQRENLYFNHSDEVFGGNSGTSQVLRTWRVFDDCSPPVSGINPGSFVQRITLQDITPPTSTLPSDSLVVFTNTSSCAASVFLPPATIFDDCSEIVQTNILVGTLALDENGGYLGELVLGNHMAEYWHIDERGNTTRDTLIISVVDRSPPALVLKPSVRVSLGSDGLAIVSPALFDLGSTDDCSSNLNFEIRRLGSTDFGPTEEVSCTDVNQRVIFTIRCTDEYGNTNSGEVEVVVADEIPPRIIPPQSLELSCQVSTDSLYKYGSPQILEACAYALTDSLAVDRSTCGVGVVKRYWIARDFAGNEVVDSQVVNFVYDLPLTESAIQWPLDTSINVCENWAPRPNGQLSFPRVVAPGCAQVSFGYNDQLFADVIGGVKLLLRHWVVLDECVYDGVAAGRFEHIQRITIFDEDAPRFDADLETINVHLDPSCRYQLNDVELFSANDCSPLELQYSLDSLIWEDESTFFASVKSSDAVKIYQRVTDEFGNSNRRTVRVNILDTIPPAVVCRDSIFIYPSTDTMEILEDDLELINLSDCNQGITVDFSPKWVSCETPSVFPIVISAIDTFGNSASCTSTAVVIDSIDRCVEVEQLVIPVSQTLNGRTIDVVYTLISAAGDTIETFATSSDSYGSFTFDSTLVDRLLLSSGTDQGAGVSSFDLYLIGQHILGRIPFTSVLEYAAADANNSRSISAYDMTLLRRFILGLTAELPAGRSYRFFGIDEPLDSLPFYRDWNDYFLPTELNSDTLYTYAVKVGDLNTAKLDARGNALKARTTEDLSFSLTSFGGSEGFALTFAGAEAVELAAFDLSVVAGELDFAAAFRHNTLHATDTRGTTRASWILPDGSTKLLSPGDTLVFGTKLKAYSLTGHAVLIEQDEAKEYRFAVTHEEDQLTDHSIRVYPNPVKRGQQLSVAPKDELREVLLYNSRGRLIEYFQGADIGRIRTLSDTLLPGLYLLELRFAGGRSQTQRLFVK